MKSRYKARYSRRYARPKKCRVVARKNPSAKPVMNKQGGVYPTTTFELVRAKLVDLGTLPTGLCGTSCGSCRWMRHNSGKIGYCKHPIVAQAVTARQCCALWRPHSGWLVPKKVMN